MSSKKRTTSNAKTTNKAANPKTRSNTPLVRDQSTTANPPSSSKHCMVDASSQIRFMDHRLSKMEEQWDSMAVALKNLSMHVANLSTNQGSSSQHKPSP
ncbi:hypothetical protein PCANC_26634 [Puccinia coronata f. sp. avenae]|uniref:Uncharacterized protein n=1 Tax=Puccinia coronata f. sp. avenae TaxID=200324 RepID=A0A2N5TL74_9BASI|nr:hypothetical protein PCANC_26634 [Puccinia coronata f. sp. avenae]